MYCGTLGDLAKIVLVKKIFRNENIVHKVFSDAIYLTTNCFELFFLTNFLLSPGLKIFDFQFFICKYNFFF